MEGYTLVSHNYARGFDFDQIDKKNQTQSKSEMQKKKIQKKSRKNFKNFFNCSRILRFFLIFCIFFCISDF